MATLYGAGLERVMRFARLTGIVIVIVAASAAVVGTDHASAEPPPQPVDSHPLSAPLAELASSGADPGSSEAAAIVGTSLGGVGSLQFDMRKRLAVTVRFTSMPSAFVVAAITALDAEVTVSQRHAAATVLIPQSNLPDLAAIPTVKTVVPALAPQLSRSQPTPGGLAAVSGRRKSLAAPAISDSQCRSIPVDADEPLRTAAARDRFGVDGSGVTVGIVSDSFDTSTTAATTAADDVASGVLPGPGNPCGFFAPVRIVADDLNDGTDEGRAMAQLVHGVAPGAELMFAAAGFDQYQFADRIIALADAGANIIVDDVQFLGETNYQEGVISAAIREVSARGVLYVTLAGNNNALGAGGSGSEGLPLGSWATDRYDPVACPVGLVAQIAWLDESLTDCANFALDDDDPSTPSVAARNGIRIDADLSIAATVQWAEPADGVNGNFSIAVTDLSGAVVVAQQRTDADLPLLVMDLLPPDGAGFYFISIIRQSTPGSVADITPAFTLGFWQAYQSIGDLQYSRSGRGPSGARITVGPTVWGHSGDESAITIGASESDAPNEVSWFSSLGPVERLFEPWRMDGTPSAPLAETQIRSKPDAISVNWVRTSFFRPTGSTPEEYRFTGTSAAAPLAAGVLALGLQYAPESGPDEQRAALAATATALSSPFQWVSTENYSGAGLINAESYLASLPPQGVLAATGVEPGSLGLASFAAVLIGLLLAAGATRRWAVRR